MLQEYIQYADLIGWIANCFILFGMYNIGKKRVSGFYFNIIAHIVWSFQSILLAMSSLFVIDLLLIIMNIFGIKTWRKEKKKNG